MHTNTIHIVLTCDNDFAIMASACLKSIEATHKGEMDVKIWFVSDGITEKNQQRLKDTTRFSIEFIDMKNAIPPGMTMPSDTSLFPLNVYLRLYIPYFIPQEITQVIYMDVDMILKADIQDLYTTDLSNHIIAAVPDMRVTTFDNSWGGILNYKELNLPGDAPYFNAGMFVINTNQWRAANTTERVLKVINENPKYLNYPDQYALNVLFVNSWKQLHQGWNFFVSEPPQEPIYLLHFVSRKPIYKTYSGKPEYKVEFDKYLALTPWKGTKPIGESSRYFKKLSIVWEKFVAKFTK
ncbi:MAG: glycosyltransferase family 8 protein [Bacteroidetes bacterium]|nr:MAG: glycosyltransferase family 8 protein [Bacteroidota bacterium]TAF93584.1 MAG: glycosyltransferase family 8 protein [Bacteroidota bacterium]